MNVCSNRYERSIYCMGKHYYTDAERMSFVKKWRISGLPMKTFARENGLCRETFREWANAYRDLEGSFVRINIDESNPHQLMKTDDVTMNILEEEQVIKKSHHFSRFDHSIVLVEVKGIKITTSLEQALAILDKVL